MMALPFGCSRKISLGLIASPWTSLVERPHLDLVFVVDFFLGFWPCFFCLFLFACMYPAKTNLGVIEKDEVREKVTTRTLIPLDVFDENDNGSALNTLHRQLFRSSTWSHIISYI